MVTFIFIFLQSKFVLTFKEEGLLSSHSNALRRGKGCTAPFDFPKGEQMG